MKMKKKKKKYHVHQGTLVCVRRVAQGSAQIRHFSITFPAIFPFFPFPFFPLPLCLPGTDLPFQPLLGYPRTGTP